MNNSHSLIDPIRENIRVSFEFFPPTSPKTEKNLWFTIGKLAPLAPDFASVTYGAGGGTQERTFDTVTRLQAHTGIPAASHLTIVRKTKNDIHALIDNYTEAGINRIVALRGDPPGGTCNDFEVHPGGFSSSVELIEAIKKRGDFDVTVAAYPEVHPAAKSAKADMDFLKRKVDAGADRCITQFFFDADAYLRFRDRVADAGISVPVLPGILPVTNYKRVAQFAKATGASIPPWFDKIFCKLDDNPKIRELVAVSVASELCLQLKNEGVKDFHLYTLNKWESTEAICNLLGVVHRNQRDCA